LVEQCLGDGSARIEEKSADHFIGVPVGPEQVGAEMPDERVFGGGGDERNVVNAVADRRPHCIAKDDADVVVRIVHRLARGMNAPLAIHAQMAVQRLTRVEPDQDVLAARHDVSDVLASEISGREVCDAKIGGGQGPIGERCA